MNDVATEPKWRTAALVAVFGGTGGLTAWVWSITVGTPLELDVAAAVAANVFLGVVAGFVGIYAIKLDSSRALMHSLALALLCGFAWKPMLEAGRELVITRIQEGEVAEKADAAERTIEALRKADPETAPILIEQLESATTQLMQSEATVRSSSLRSDIDRVVVESVETLQQAAEKAPEAGARALGAIGAAAAASDRPAVSKVAAEGLARIAERQDFEVGASSEVSNSLLRLSAAARAGAQEDLAGALREQSRDVVRQAEIRARRRDPSRIPELHERSIVIREAPPPQR